MRLISLLYISLFLLTGCFHELYPGPDKRFLSMSSGAITGAGAGAVAGFHLSSATGPGALVGAGFGAVAGSLHGFVHDLHEETLLTLQSETRRERQVARAHELLAEHYKRRMELHPTRDIFPADLFFEADEAKLRPEACPLVEELARLNKNRFPWSRLVIANYIRTSDPRSTYAEHLAIERVKELSNHFVKAGIEPRRITTRAVIVPDVILVDPADRSDRYAQAIELIPIDR